MKNKFNKFLGKRGNRNILDHALDYYADLEYHYIEVPWIVSKKVAQMTIPKGKKPFKVGRDQVLIGSAEQGFLCLLESNSLAPNTNYISISPCFRNEPEDELKYGYKQTTFTKVELFSFHRDEDTALKYSAKKLAEAKNFFSYYLAFSRDEKKMTIENTDEGFFDICIDGVELGSYGTREIKFGKQKYFTSFGRDSFESAKLTTGEFNEP